MVHIDLVSRWVGDALDEEVEVVDSTGSSSQLHAAKLTTAQDNITMDITDLREDAESSTRCDTQLAVVSKTDEVAMLPTVASVCSSTQSTQSFPSQMKENSSQEDRSVLQRVRPRTSRPSSHQQLSPRSAKTRSARRSMTPPRSSRQLRHASSHSPNTTRNTGEDQSMGRQPSRRRRRRRMVSATTDQFERRETASEKQGETPKQQAMPAHGHLQPSDIDREFGVGASASLEHLRTWLLRKGQAATAATMTGKSSACKQLLSEFDSHTSPSMASRESDMNVGSSWFEEGRISFNMAPLARHGTIKQCQKCGNCYAGFGTVCGRCRKSGPLGSVQRCPHCSQYHHGFRDCCGECSA